MPKVIANGIELEYERYGDPAGETVLFIMGLGAQLTRWPLSVVEAMTGRGYQVIRYDNRDVGLSHRFESAGPPDIAAILAARAAGAPSPAAYLVEDMAADAAGLLDALNIPRAHIVGASMGGMIAQELAARYPDKALSLTSIMSTTGNPGLAKSTPEAAARLTTRPPAEAGIEAAVEFALETARIVGSPGYPFNDDEMRARLRADAERAVYPLGVARQYASVLASGDRRASVATIKCPTVVLHGADDPLVPVDGGEDTAKVIPGAELRIIPGMGHDLPIALIPILVDAIEAAAARSRQPA
jgi:pimeloyl-ACP methyl ester carboxylesterase